MADSKEYFVFKIVNSINNKIFIGIHYGFIDDDNLQSNELLNEEKLKYSQNAFAKSIVEVCDTRDKAEERKKYWIENLNTLFPDGYNFERW